MTGWSLAGIALTAYVVLTIILSRRRLAEIQVLGLSRAPMSQEHFAAELSDSGVSLEIGDAIYVAALPYYSGRATPYPDDQPLPPPLSVNGDDLSEIMMDNCKALGLPKRAMPMQISGECWRDLAVFREIERERLKGDG